MAGVAKRGPQSKQLHLVCTLCQLLEQLLLQLCAQKTELQVCEPTLLYDCLRTCCGMLGLQCDFSVNQEYDVDSGCACMSAVNS